MNFQLGRGVLLGIIIRHIPPTYTHLVPEKMKYVKFTQVDHFNLYSTSKIPPLVCPYVKNWVPGNSVGENRVMRGLGAVASKGWQNWQKVLWKFKFLDTAVAVTYPILCRSKFVKMSQNSIVNNETPQNSNTNYDTGDHYCTTSVLLPTEDEKKKFTGSFSMHLSY